MPILSDSALIPPEKQTEISNHLFASLIPLHEVSLGLNLKITWALRSICSGKFHYFRPSVMYFRIFPSIHEICSVQLLKWIDRWWCPGRPVSKSAHHGVFYYGRERSFLLLLLNILVLFCSARHHHYRSFRLEANELLSWWYFLC